jgi:hypothetical protein
MPYDIKKYKSLYHVPTVDFGSILLFLSTNESSREIFVFRNSKI